MKVLSSILLVAMFLLPTRLVCAQGVIPTASPVPSPSPSPSATPALSPELQKALVKKTSQSSPAKVINRPPPPIQYDPKNLQFLPPSKNFVPSTKTSVMTSLVCSENKYLRVTTEGLVPFSMSFIKFTGDGQILVMQIDGSYLPYVMESEPSPVRSEDVVLAQKIVKALKPKKLTIMPKLIAMEKEYMSASDPFTLMEILRDHFGRDSYDVNVAKPSDCYVVPKPTPEVSPTPTPVTLLRDGIS